MPEPNPLTKLVVNVRNVLAEMGKEFTIQEVEDCFEGFCEETARVLDGQKDPLDVGLWMFHKDNQNAHEQACMFAAYCVVKRRSGEV